MTSIPSGTQFQGVIPSNGYKNKKSALLNSLSPLYTIEDIAAASGGALTVATLTLQGTTAATTSQAIYGINVIDTATTSALATRLPDPTTGKQTTFVNTSSMSILVFPSVTGGKINGVVDGYASIPNDGNPYTFSCVANPLPGAWVWSLPATGQIQLPTISVAHTNGTGTSAWGVGKAGAQLINPAGANWYDNLSITGFPTLTFNVISGSAPGQDYWSSLTGIVGNRQLVNTKVYSNFLETDSPAPSAVRPTVGRFVAYKATPNSYANYTASGVKIGTNAADGGIATPNGPLNNPVEVGDVGTIYNIQPANLVQVSPVQTDDMGPDNYFTFNIGIHPLMATKTYKFDIFLEHT
tara:strand:- start:214 stop:1272 length:1059 start_codon:yes stop_codon:yes gene_type:complete